MILIALAWLLILMDPAAADPGTVGVLVASAFAVELAATSTTAIVIGNVVITAAAIALSVGANALLTRPQQEAASSGQFVTRQPTPSRRRNYGRAKVAGATIFSEVVDMTIGLSSIPTLCRVVAINEGEIDAFEGFYLDDNPIALTGTTSGIVIAAYSVGPVPYAAMDTRVGATPSSAYSSLTTDFPSIWDSDYRGDGIASVLIMTGQPPDFENFTTAYPGGTPPNPRCVIRAVKVWDPRDGGQDRDDPSTWEWSDNPVLIALDFHRHQDGLGLAFSYDSAGAVVYRSDMDDLFFTSGALTEWEDAADICEEDVDGVQRYRCGGGYSIADDAPAEVLAGILASCDGQTYQRGDGAIGIRVGKTVDPAITLTDDNILGYSDLKKGDNVFLACNEVTAKFVSPDHDYQLVDAEAWRDDTDITNRGQVLTKQLSLPWVQNHSQCRRLQKIAHARFNPEWQGTIITDMAGLALLNERYVHLTISEVDEVGGSLDLIDLDFEIVPDSMQVAISDQGITCRIGVISIAQSAYDWDEGSEAGTPPAIPADE